MQFKLTFETSFYEKPKVCKALKEAFKRLGFRIEAETEYNATFSKVFKKAMFTSPQRPCGNFRGLGRKWMWFMVHLEDELFHLRFHRGIHKVTFEILGFTYFLSIHSIGTKGYSTESEAETPGRLRWELEMDYEGANRFPRVFRRFTEEAERAAESFIIHENAKQVVALMRQGKAEVAEKILDQIVELSEVRPSM